MMQNCSGKGSETLTFEETEMLKQILAELKILSQKLDLANSYLDQISNR